MFDQRFVKSDQIPASTIKADPEIARKISAASTGEGGMAQASSFIDALDADPAVIKMAGGRQRILDRREKTAIARIKSHAVGLGYKILDNKKIDPIINVNAQNQLVPVGPHRINLRLEKVSSDNLYKSTLKIQVPLIKDPGYAPGKDNQHEIFLYAIFSGDDYVETGQQRYNEPYRLDELHDVLNVITEFHLYVEYSDVMCFENKYSRSFEGHTDSVFRSIEDYMSINRDTIIDNNMSGQDIAIKVLKDSPEYQKFETELEIFLDALSDVVNQDDIQYKLRPRIDNQIEFMIREMKDYAEEISFNMGIDLDELGEHI